MDHRVRDTSFRNCERDQACKELPSRPIVLANDESCRLIAECVGGEPASVVFCHQIGLNYVSCSPFRVPIARLAAAQAALKK
ncbi:MAG: putative PEP-binding protein [Pirellulaceae bacterium]|nr:putative PEP-binding protein [Pirellulaceae bacterium]